MSGNKKLLILSLAGPLAIIFSGMFPTPWRGFVLVAGLLSLVATYHYIVKAWKEDFPDPETGTHQSSREN